MEDFPSYSTFSTLFLDRDGTINKRIKNGYVQTWKEFEFLPGSLEGIYRLSQIFDRIIVVTNQQGIGKGLMTHEELKVIHDNMINDITIAHGRIDQIYYCPQLEIFNPWCRKPNPGMALQAQHDFPDIEFDHSIMIGDSDVDIAFGKKLGMLTVRINNGDKFQLSNEIADVSATSLLDFYNNIKNKKS